MSFKSEFTEVYNYLSDCCKDPIFTTLEASEDDFLWKDEDVKSGVIIDYLGSASKVKIPKGVVEIGSSDGKGNYYSDGSYGCFAGCAVTDVFLLDGLEKIGPHAFEDCYSLESITIPNGVTSIGLYAFYDCKNLKSINIPQSVKSIDNLAFAYCEELTSIVIFKGLEAIGSFAFKDCKSLVSIEIPDSVTSIGYHVFEGSGLTEITCSKGLNLSDAKVPKNCKVICR